MMKDSGENQATFQIKIKFLLKFGYSYSISSFRSFLLLKTAMIENESICLVNLICIKNDCKNKKFYCYECEFNNKNINKEDLVQNKDKILIKNFDNKII